MSTTPVTPTPQSDPFAEFGGASTGNVTPATTAQPAQPVAQPTQSNPFAEFGGVKVEPEAKPSNDPRQTGEIVNDVGQKVIVPKDGESFADTMKRAVAYHKSLTTAQQQAALDAEAKTAPKKALQTLGAAATIGAVGPAVMALPGEVAEAIPSVLAHTIDGVKAIGTWASKNPVQAYLLFQVMKEIVPGAKKAMGIVKGIPEAE
jgi:hypothetical protein